MSLTASLFGSDAPKSDDPFAKKAAPVEEKTDQVPADTKKEGKKSKKADKRARDGEDDAAEEAAAVDMSEAFSKNKKVDDLFKLQPAGVRESRREKTVREIETRETESKTQGKKLTAHERLKKKHLSHAVDRHDDEDGRTVFVGNLPNDIDKRKVMAFFKDCGEIENARIRCQTLLRQDTKERGRAIRVLRKEFEKGEDYSATAYVLFSHKNSVAKAVQKSGMVFMDRHIVVSEENAMSKAFDPKTSAFLGNLGYDTSDEQVWRFFADNGITDVRRVRLVRDRLTGRNKGIGYVEFSSPNSCNTAINLRGRTINGREVRMCHVQKSKDPAIAKLQSSRRDARKVKTKDAKKSGPLKKGQTSDQVRKVVVKEDMPSWMGTVTNARKKLARDLRPLIPNNVVLSREQKKKKNHMAAQKAGTTAPTHGWDDGK
eukprot:GILI01015260.1.p1 GENE.GILI01015260.1~~GILI01015260.1.p1  ORF type:complete len:430 (-),score=135.18 GILI01015260.1:96-1385(-)